MFRLLKFTFKTIALLKLLAIAFSAGMGAAFIMQLRAQYRTWGLAGGVAERALPGDDLVAEADAVETRVIDIDAPPAEVWPWLVQMGYGRGGWYSYGQLDRPWSPGGGAPGSSADTILEEHQALAEGDVVPTHREGGFVARIVEPGEAMALYLDDQMMREQIEEMVANAVEDPEDAKVEMDMPPYSVSWAFVLEDAPCDRARLIERMRFHVHDISPGQRRATPLLALGVFALMRSQMLGIKSRVEAAALAED